ncbi:FxsA family protein [Ornithinimicrobium sp. Arc0846-15]|nr:FxsA family protein [Ornithinimicrobium laminariae]
MASTQSVGPTGRGGRRARWILIGVLLLMLAEIVTMIAVGQALGVWWTLLLLVVLAFGGAWLVRREGLRAWRRLQSAKGDPQNAGREVLDAAVILVGGFLLLTPGFLTATVGLFMVLPLTRPITRGWVSTMASTRSPMMGATGGVRRPPPGSGDIIEGEIVNDSSEHNARDPRTDPRLE